MKKVAIIITLFTLSLFGVEFTSQAEKLYLSNGCPSCHGFFGQGTGSGPRLQNKKEKLLLKRLQNLQKGITRTSNGSVMISFAQSLDANQTKAMAYYLSIITTSNANQEYIDYEDHANGGS